MRKLIVLGIVVAMVLGLAAASQATLDKSWNCYLIASLTTAGTGMPEAKFGTKSTGTVDTTGQYAANYDPSTPEIRYWDAGRTIESRYYVDIKPWSLNDPSTTKVVWKLEAYAPGLTYYVSMYGDGGLGLEPGFTVKLYDYTGGVQGSEVLAELLPGDSGASGPMSGDYTQLGTFTGTHDFILVAENLVPEPGSIIALLTGLVGLVGLRRRK